MIPREMLISHHSLKLLKSVSYCDFDVNLILVKIDMLKVFQE